MTGAVLTMLCRLPQALKIMRKPEMLSISLLATASHGILARPPARADRLAG